MGILFKVSTKKAPTTTGYTNKDIYICGLKYIRKNINIRKSMMTDSVYSIMKNDEILYAVYSRFAGEPFLGHIKIQMFIVTGIKEFKYHLKSQKSFLYDMEG